MTERKSDGEEKWRSCCEERVLKERVGRKKVEEMKEYGLRKRNGRNQER